MGTSQNIDRLRQAPICDRELNAFIEDRRRAREPVKDLEAFEGELRERFRAAEAEAMAEEFARFDIDAPAVEIDGVPHRRVLRCSQTYMTASGPVSVERTLYPTRQDSERAVAAMELRAGIVAGTSLPWRTLFVKGWSAEVEQQFVAVRDRIRRARVEAWLTTPSGQALRDSIEAGNG